MTRHSLYALLAILLLTAAARAELEIGKPIPMADYAMTGVDGKQITLDAIKGEKGTVVVFWCNHCPFVVKWRSRLVDIGNDYAKQGFGFVAVNSNDPAQVAGDSLDAMKKDAEAAKYGFPYVVDQGSKLAAAFGATKTPHVYLFDAKGTLVYVGAIDDNSADAAKVEKPYLRQALDAVAKGEAVPVANTKALGCTIKWYK